MNAAETQARWGLPDWTRPDMYPDAAETSNSIWRWEFLRRQPNYRRQFSISAEWHTPSKLINEPAQPILTYVGGAMMPDPRHPLDANLALVILEAFNATHGFIVPREGSRRFPAHYTGDGLVDYRFSLAEPLGPQLKKATEELDAAQAETRGKKNTERPSRELWPTYLRILDAKECGASWQIIGKTLWPDLSGTKDRARHTYDSAVRVRDNFQI